ncbi:PulJ/GspJ family protein [Phytohalomonas tamaricis]|uniref:PulJ/GspJ family protein n=1 Tax=Phytohalomonas tamaricis TaxID=2081032 RepID=UPI000D0B8D3D|nr:prepilin-type N-terminal cleavage/methylation domain-containing protein [Phytohalomonas tamaricis]
MTRHCHSSQRGFTLLEVIVAIALTALIGVTVAALVNSMVTTRERLKEPPDLRQDARLSQLLERRLEALTVRPLHVKGQPLLNAPLDYLPDLHMLEWVAKGDWPLPMGDHYTRLRRQRLVWDSDDHRLWLGSTGLLDDTGMPQWQTSASLDDVERVQFEFYNGARWVASPPDNTLPTGIRLQWWRNGVHFQMSALLPYWEAS